MDASIRTDQLTWKGACIFVAVLTVGGLITEGTRALFHRDQQVFEALKPPVVGEGIAHQTADRQGDDDNADPDEDAILADSFKTLGDGVIGFELPPATATVPRSKSAGPDPNALLRYLMSGTWVRGHGDVWEFEFPMNSTMASGNWIFQEGRAEWTGD